MKKYCQWMSFAAMLCVGTGVFAQQKSISQQIEDKNGKLKIHIETSEGGKKEVFDKEYDTKGWSDADKEKLISRISDSLALGTTDGKKARYKIKIETNKNREESITLGQKPQIHLDKKIMLGDSLETEIISKSFHSDGILGQMFPQTETLVNGQVFVWKDKNKEAKTIKSLRVYPNKPFDSKLNVHFVAPEKGDVSIRVNDVEGNEVSVQKIKDFEGEFMGQIDLKKNAKGTLFVTVTQKGDGSVQRIVIE